MLKRDDVDFQRPKHTSNRRSRFASAALVLPPERRVAQHERFATADHGKVIAFRWRARAQHPASGLPIPDGPQFSNVIRFQPRRDAARRWDAIGEAHRKISREIALQEDEEYRHRMAVNLLAIAASLLLIACGYWIANGLANVQ
jgi:hypothetical protein